MALGVRWWRRRGPPGCSRRSTTGMTGADTVWYHLPQAARFVQDGSITHVQFFETGAGTAFYPATSGLFHALGMLWFGNDFLSLFLNLGWLGLALLAAWCLGRPYGLGPALRARRDACAGHPDHGGDPAGRRLQRPGGAGAAPGRRGAARERRAHGCGGHAGRAGGGPALGHEAPMAVPLAALAVGAVAVAPRRRAAAHRGVWLGAAARAGRRSGSRGTCSHSGTRSRPRTSTWARSRCPRRRSPSSPSRVHYFGHAGRVAGTFLPGLLDALRPAWWALLGLAAVGMVAVAVSGPHARGADARAWWRS